MTHNSLWVPTLYLAEALPYSAVMLMSVVLYKDFGLSDTQIALYTSYLGLPWVIKPIWSSLVDNLRTKRWWILTTQYLMTLALALVAFALQIDFWLQTTLALFMLVALCSATHDIAADGFYILSLTEREQSVYVGVRNTLYRVGMVTVQGGLVMLSGLLAPHGTALAWAAVLGLLSAVMLLLAVAHTFTLPRSEHPKHERLHITQQFAELWQTILCFLRKPHVGSALAFILLFRLPEGLLTKIVPIFMMRPVAEGGLGLSNEQFGFTFGTLGVIGMLLGGILGGLAVARWGYRRCLWPLVLCFTVPDVVYVWLSTASITSLPIISTCVFVEQMGYGLGFAAYTLYLIQFARGERSTAIFSLCTAGQFLGGAVLPGMLSGYLSESVGYTNFFLIVLALCSITFAVTFFATRAAAARLPR